MARCKVFFAILSVGLLVSVTTSQLVVPCNYTEIQGPYCHDCQTRAICTPLGGILVFRCWLPHLKHCVNGHCALDPSPDCATATTTGRPSTTSPPPTEEGTSTITEPTTVSH